MHRHTQKGICQMRKGDDTELARVNVCRKSLNGSHKLGTQEHNAISNGQIGAGSFCECGKCKNTITTTTTNRQNSKKKNVAKVMIGLTCECYLYSSSFGIYTHTLLLPECSCINQVVWTTYDVLVFG